MASATETLPKLEIETRLFIGGEFFDSAESGRIPVQNPHDISLLAEVAEARAADIDRAVEAARKAFPAWKRTPAAERGRLLYKLADAIEACWTHDPQRGDHLADYLWAAAQCGGERTEELLTPVCAGWSALPARGETDSRRSPRDDLAAHNVEWAFWKSLPQKALFYFIARAAQSDLR